MSHCIHCNSVGITASLSNGILNTLEMCKSLNCKCCQISLDNKLFNSELEKEKTLQYMLQNGLYFYIHTPVWCNLSLDAKVDEKNISNKSKGIVQSQLNQVLDLPSACVLHIGTGGSIQNVADKINSMNIVENKYVKNPLLMEISAGQGGQLGNDWDQIRSLFEAIDKPVGLCLDTQHAFGAGLTDWNETDSVVKLFDMAQTYSNGIGLIHLNDSKVDYKSNIDRHAGLGKGKIWYKNKDSLKELIQRCDEDDINLVLETDSQLKDLKLIESFKENI